MTEPAPGWESAPEPGRLDPALAEEFPGLGLAHTSVGVGGGRSSPALKQRLRALSDRFGGAQAIHLRQQPIPHAYRVFFRQIGLDPDATPPPAEQVSLNRMREGRYRSRNRTDDALTVAVAEVGVAMLALDAGKVEGRLGMRLAAEDERIEGRTSPIVPGTILIADETRPLAILFGRIAEGREVTKRTERTALVAIKVKGVPDIALEEALWVAAGAMLA